MKQSKKQIRIIKEKPVYKNSYGTLFDDDVEFTTSAKIGKFVRWRWKAPYSVAILPVLGLSHLVLLRNFRHAVRKTILEVPKGFGDSHKKPIEVARNEMRREAGLSSNRIDYIGTAATDPSFIYNPMHLFIAWECFESTTQYEESEVILGKRKFELRKFPEGYLVPAIRSNLSSLEDLRKKQLKLSDVPSQEYTSFVQDRLGGSRENYDLERVSQLFYKRTLNAFSSADNSGPGKLSKEKIDYVYRAILEMPELDPDRILKYSSVREWAKGEVKNGKLIDRDYNLVDHLVASCYSNNVAISMQANIDVPITIPELEGVYPFELVFGDVRAHNRLARKRAIAKEWLLPPAIFLSEEFLAHMPAEALTYIKGSKSKNTQPLVNYQTVTDLLEEYREKQTIDIENFVHELVVYLAEVDVIVLDFLSGRNKSGYLEKKRKAKRGAKLKIVTNAGLSAISLIPGAGAITVAQAAYGAIADLRGAEKQKEWLSGYMAGRAIQGEKLLLGVV